MARYVDTEIFISRNSQWELSITLLEAWNIHVNFTLEQATKAPRGVEV